MGEPEYLSDREVEQLQAASQLVKESTNFSNRRKDVSFLEFLLVRAPASTPIAASLILTTLSFNDFQAAILEN